MCAQFVQKVVLFKGTNQSSILAEYACRLSYLVLNTLKKTKVFFSLGAV